MAGTGPMAGLTANPSGRGSGAAPDANGSPSSAHAGCWGCVVMALLAYMSSTISPLGRAQQMSTSPSAGFSSGAGEYVMLPDSRGVVQVWQTPVRQLQRVGTSQASANSSMLRRSLPNGAVIPLRAKVTAGPVPA